MREQEAAHEYLFHHMPISFELKAHPKNVEVYEEDPVDLYETGTQLENYSFGSNPSQVESTSDIAFPSTTQYIEHLVSYLSNFFSPQCLHSLHVLSFLT